MRVGVALVAHEQPSASDASVGPIVIDVLPPLSVLFPPLTDDPTLPVLSPVDDAAVVAAGSLVPSVSQGLTMNDPSGTQPVVVPSLLPGKIVSKLLG